MKINNYHEGQMSTRGRSKQFISSQSNNQNDLFQTETLGVNSQNLLVYNKEYDNYIVLKVITPCMLISWIKALLSWLWELLWEFDKISSVQSIHLFVILTEFR